MSTTGSRRMSFIGIALFALFGATVYLASQLLPLVDHTLLVFGICLLPMLPATIGLMLASGRLRGLDEMALRIQLEAAAFGLAFTMIAGFALGLQQVISPAYRFNAAWAVPVAGFGWIIGSLYSRRKFL